MALKTSIQLRRDHLSAWQEKDPVLKSGEIALVDKSNGLGDKEEWVFRIGNGISSFNDLPETAYALSANVSNITDALSAEISGKVKVEGNSVSGINVVRVDAETYHELILDDDIDPCTLYIVSSDNINAFGGRVTNVGDAEELSDAVNLKQLNAVKSNLSAYDISISSLGREGDKFSYQISQGGVEKGIIEVPYDVFVDGGSIETIDDKTWLFLTLNNQASTVLSIEATDLVDIYTAVNKTVAEGGTVSVEISNFTVSAQVLDSSITTSKIADSNVTTDKIADSNVTTDKIADGAITPDKMTDLSIFVFDCGGAAAE